MNFMNDNLETRRARSSSYHRSLRSSPATSPVDFGAFYCRLLQTGVWPSQRALAAALTVSNSHVSRCISIERLPKIVLEAFGGARYVSFRLGRELLKLTREIEYRDLRKRAVKAKGLQLVDPDEILQFLRSGDGPGRRNARLSISVDRGGKVVRIEGPDVEKLARNLGVLRDAIRECVKCLDKANSDFANIMADHDQCLEKP